jgi:hypothetical protein
MPETPRQPIEQNAGRCDICGSPIDMTSGDELVISEFGPPQEVVEEHGIDPEQAVTAVADTFDDLAESPEGHELADVIRETAEMKVHQSCLDDTNWHMMQAGSQPAD